MLIIFQIWLMDDFTLFDNVKEFQYKIHHFEVSSVYAHWH